MKVRVPVILSTLLVVVAVIVWRGIVGDNASPTATAMASGLAVFSAGIAAAVIRRRRNYGDRSREADSVERISADSAQAGVFADAIIVGMGLGCTLVLWPVLPASVAVLALVAFLIVDFYIRFARLKRQAGLSS